MRKKNLISPQRISPREYYNTSQNRTQRSHINENDENLHLSGLGISKNADEKSVSQYFSQSEDHRMNASNLNTSRRAIQERHQPLAQIENFNNKDFGLDLSKVDRKDDQVGSYETFKKKNSAHTEKENLTGYSLVDKMNKIEESYQVKVGILEERLYSSEYEAEKFRKANERLEYENSRLRAEISDLQNRLGMEQRRKAENEEIALSQVQVENERLKLRLEEMKRECRDTLEEKDAIKAQYQQLMKVHNQMIELDMQKNEKTLRETHISMRRDEEVEDFAESILAYQHEVEVLKENNNLVQKQMMFELQKLQTDLKNQQEEKERILKAFNEERLHWQQRIASPRRETIKMIERIERSPSRSRERSASKNRERSRQDYVEEKTVQIRKNEHNKSIRDWDNEDSIRAARHQKRDLQARSQSNLK